MVSFAMRRFVFLGFLGISHEAFEFAIACVAIFIDQTELIRRRAGLGDKLVILSLRQIDQLAVIAEIFVSKLRVTVEAETLDDQQIEMTH